MRRNEKARIKALWKSARAGNHNTRADAKTAYRVRVLRLAAGHEEEESDLAAAGALLEAATDWETQDLHRLVNDYLTQEH